MRSEAEIEERIQRRKRSKAWWGRRMGLETGALGKYAQEEEQRCIDELLWVLSTADRRELLEGDHG